MWTTPLILLLLSFYGISSEIIPDDPGFVDHLFNGIIPPRAHFHGFVVQDNNREVVEKFLARVTRSIESKDASIIGGLFQPGFIFKGCKGTYNKQQVIGMISQIPAGTNFHFVLKTVEDDGDSIKYSVSVSGFGPSPLEAEFTLNKVDQQLHCGRIPACQKTHFHGFISQESAKETVTNFLTKLEIAFKSKDTNSITNFFKPSFVFVGCMGTYNREQSIELIQMIPSDSKLNYSYKSVEDLGETIKANVLASGFKSFHVEFEFVLNKKDQQIESARMPDCPKRRFNGVGGGEAQLGFSYQESPTTVIERFLGRLTRSIEAKNVRAILDLLQGGFMFKGCKDKYNKCKYFKISEISNH
ncbi:hypothetical protein CRE_03709 [Caenorhabditis remanei]|uniref:NTF2-like domain-containing protein n=1 Tax=Caenorhabditis remanei TaxID=31234 RepID=E3LXU6_CAERE|nr:hypothetical protein CRE_03709 [Caenorhabditis remanei]